MKLERKSAKCQERKRDFRSMRRERADFPQLPAEVPVKDGKSLGPLDFDHDCPPDGDLVQGLAGGCDPNSRIARCGGAEGEIALASARTLRPRNSHWNPIDQISMRAMSFISRKLPARKTAVAALVKGTQANQIHAIRREAGSDSLSERNEKTAITIRRPIRR